ncbi:MAG: prepilin peptidase [Patescibacteria group bacterium]
MLLYNSIFGILIFIFGTVIGSFLNVVIYRVGSGVGYLGRSKCLSCGKVLTAKMLIPLLSFFWKGGRCAYCGTKLSWQYPLVEGASGALFVMVWLVTGFDPLTVFTLAVSLWQNGLSRLPSSGMEVAFFFFVDATIWLILLAITAYDLRHKIIPDRFVLYFTLLGGLRLLFRWRFGLLSASFVPFLGSFVPVWVDILAGPLLALPFAMLWFFSGGRAMGLGDAKLAFGLGWFLGFSGGISAVILAFWTAFFPSLYLLFLSRKRFTMKSKIPFAPFLIFGALLVFAGGIDILQWSF